MKITLTNFLHLCLSQRIIFLSFKIMAACLPLFLILSDNEKQFSATTYVFHTAGNWSTASNWSPEYPGTSIPTGHTISIQATCIQDVAVSSSSPVTIEAGASIAINEGNLTMSGIGGNLLNNGSITVGSGRTLGIGGSFTHNGTDVIVSGTLSGFDNLNVNAGKTLIINSGGTFSGGGSISGTLMNEGAVSVNYPRNLTINSGGKFIHNGTSAIVYGGSLTNNGIVRVNTGKTLTFSIYNNWVLYYGTFTHNGDSATISGILQNNGLVYVNAGKTLIVESGGTLNNTYNTSVFGTLSNQGTLNSNSMTINSGGTFTHDGISATISGTLTNNGEVNLNAGKTMTIGGTFTHNGTSASISGTLTNNGTVNVNANKTLTINNGGTFIHNGTNASISGTLTNNGTITVNTGKTLTQMSGGTIANNDILNGGGAISTVGGPYNNPAAGTVSPGSSPGCLTFSNGFSNSGRIAIEVYGPTACTEFDRISVTGTATLGGTLDATINYPSPSNGQLITFLTATSINGTFSNINPPLPTGWSLAYNIPSTGHVSLQYELLLPVELVNFRAELQADDEVFLSWQTASELNNLGFHIERSTDGQNWQNLGFISGNGASQSEHSYQFTDERPLPGINYYRLRQVDFDGKSEYSGVVSVDFKNFHEFGNLTVYPNPVSHGELTLHCPDEVDDNTTIRIFSAAGQLVLQQPAQPFGNSLDVSGLAPGIYMLEVTSAGTLWRERVVVK